MSFARPDFDQRIYLPQRIIAVIDALADEGVGAEQVLEGSGLTPRDLQNLSLRTSYRQLISVFRNALKLSRTPEIALRAGQRMRLTAFGMYGYALQSCRTGWDTVDFTRKYMPIIGSTLRINFVQDAGTLCYETAVVIADDPLSDLYRFALEFGLAAHVSLVRDIHTALSPTRVDIVYPAPAHAEAYERAFRCPVRFGQPINQLLADAATFDQQIAMADRVTHAIASEACAQMLGALERPASCAADVRQSLLRSPGQFPSLETMAEALSLSPRQLRRKLDAEQTSYRDVVAEVRKELAMKYLRETRLSHEEIASRLGYSDGANFRRAFLKWTGRNPSCFQGSDVEVG